MIEAEEVPVRRVMTQATEIVGKELDRLREEIRRKDEIIDSQAKENRRLKENDIYLSQSY